MSKRRTEKDEKKAQHQSDVEYWQKQKCWADFGNAKDDRGYNICGICPAKRECQKAYIHNLKASEGLEPAVEESKDEVPNL